MLSMTILNSKDTVHYWLWNLPPYGKWQTDQDCNQLETIDGLQLESSLQNLAKYLIHNDKYNCTINIKGTIC